jgi:hypothetical protein
MCLPKTHVDGSIPPDQAREYAVDVADIHQRILTGQRHRLEICIKETDGITSLVGY